MNIPLPRSEKALIPKFANLTAITQQNLVAVAKSYINGSATKEQLERNLEGILEVAHTKAAALGRVLAQNASPGRVAPLDREFGVWAVGQQREFLPGFVQAIVDGKYVPKDNSDQESIDRAFNALAHRTILYARGLRATAEEAWIYTLSDGTRFIWLLGIGVEEHCEVCPEYARTSQRKPYTYDTLPTVPGGMKTPCGVNCDCRLQTVQGRLSFPFITLIGSTGFSVDPAWFVNAQKTQVGNGGDIAL